MCAATTVQVLLPVPLEIMLEKRHCGCKDARLDASRLNVMNAEAEDHVKLVVVLFRTQLEDGVSHGVSLHGQVDNVVAMDLGMNPSNCSQLPA